MTKQEKEKLYRLEDLVNHLNGGGYDTSDLKWIILQYKKLKEAK